MKQANAHKINRSSDPGPAGETTEKSGNHDDTRRVRFLHVFPTLALGGAEIRIIRTINRMGPNSGHALLSIDGIITAASLLDPNCGVKVFKGSNIQPGLKKPLSLWKQIAEIDPKVLLTYNWGATDALIAARLKRFRPVIHNECGLSCNDDGKTYRRQIARRLLLPHCEKVVVTAESFAALALEKYGVSASKLALIHPGVDTARFSPDRNMEIRRKIAPGRNGSVVVYVGNLRKSKNLPTLIRAFSKVASQQDRLALFGDGPERGAAERLISELGIQDQTYLHGFIDKPEDAFKAGDIYATATESEAASNSLLEGMACGLPVVATDVGDNRAILAESNRKYTCAPYELDTFTNHLKSLLCDPTLREKLARDNRARVLSQYSLDRLHSNFHKLWLSVAESSTW